MKRTDFTADEIKGYYKRDENYLWPFHAQAKERAQEMNVHKDGVYPEHLLDTRRPNETEQVQQYRKSIFVAKTKPYFLKIVTSLSKIRRSSDWSIIYSGDFPRIPDGESLQDYCEKNYPEFGSVTNWVFSVLLAKYLADANAAVCVFPDEIPIEPGVFLKPTAKIYDAENVLDFWPDNYAVVEDPEGCFYETKNGRQKGKRLLLFTINNMWQFDQQDGRGSMAVSSQYKHELGFLPVRLTGGTVTHNKGGRYLNESRIAGILPEFNEALREYSDLQAAKVLHLFPERWEFTQHECQTCKGTGRRRNPAWFVGCPEDIAAEIACNADGCQSGYIASGPFSKLLLRPANQGAGELANIPTPPAGFVEKDVEIIKIQEESVTNHIIQGLAAHNFEFIASAPLNQSGLAKEVDRDELNSTVNLIAEDIVSIMDFVYKSISAYRNRVQYPGQTDDMAPTIAVPERFDILSANHLEARLSAAKGAKVNPVIINALELDYASKAFAARPDVASAVNLVLELDPLPNISMDEKAALLQNGGVSKLAYVVSGNIGYLVALATSENKKFAELDIVAQRNIINELAKKMIAEIDAEKKASMIPAAPDLDNDENEPENSDENAGE